MCRRKKTKTDAQTRTPIKRKLQETSTSTAQTCPPTGDGGDGRSRHLRGTSLEAERAPFFKWDKVVLLSLDSSHSSISQSLGYWQSKARVLRGTGKERQSRKNTHKKNTKWTRELSIIKSTEIKTVSSLAKETPKKTRSLIEQNKSPKMDPHDIINRVSNKWYGNKLRLNIHLGKRKRIETQPKSPYLIIPETKFN